MIALALLLAATPAKIAIRASTPLSVDTGACSGLVTIETQDSTGAAVPVSAATSIALSGAAGFFPASGCSADALDPSVDFVIPAGQSTASFHFVHPTAGNVTLSATFGTSTVTQTWTVNSAPGSATRLRFTSPSPTLAVGQCSPGLTFRFEDVTGQPVSPDRRIFVTLGPSGFVEIYADAGCRTQRLQGTDRAAGSPSETTIYVKPAVVGGDVEASAPGLVTGTLPLTVTGSGGGGCTSAGVGELALLGLVALRRRRP